MEGRIRDVMTCGPRGIHHTVMEADESPHNKGITLEKYDEHRGYNTHGHVETSPTPGEMCPDGPIHSGNGGRFSILLAEARKLVAKAGKKKANLSFVGVTCPLLLRGSRRCRA